jgi:acyl-CoA thioester hydrolase|tara:strand:- start:2010 stop:2405 length:396 start_codon:yes stop_codon:yes gene_type:complete
MFSLIVEPRFSETDALGHVNNTVLPVWFEQGRTPIFKIFTPSLAIDEWKLILAKIDVSFLKQIFYGKEVEVKTYIQSLGNSSLVVYHEAWQENLKVAEGTAVMVYFDHDTQKSKPLPDDIKRDLEAHLISV